MTCESELVLRVVSGFVALSQSGSELMSVAPEGHTDIQGLVRHLRP